MYDMVVIGAGLGGYACAIRAAQIIGTIFLREQVKGESKGIMEGKVEKRIRLYNCKSR